MVTTDHKEYLALTQILVFPATAAVTGQRLSIGVTRL